ncbi:MAG: hypothetical protein CTY33_02650 [Methylotenera sp.]|nr:MAG: hypothetical protein CTY33_02650 [Methylotenera sp.]
MTFQEAIKLCFQKYADFSGRAKRPEFWWFALFTFLASMILGVVSSMLSGLFSLAVIVPSLAVGARRLHDIGRSGWWQLIWLVPVIGWIIMIYWFVQESNPTTNAFDETIAA